MKDENEEKSWIIKTKKYTTLALIATLAATGVGLKDSFKDKRIVTQIIAYMENHDGKPGISQKDKADFEAKVGRCFFPIKILPDECNKYCLTKIIGRFDGGLTRRVLEMYQEGHRQKHYIPTRR